MIAVSMKKERMKCRELIVEKIDENCFSLPVKKFEPSTVDDR